jgi:sialidase-1
VLREALAGPEFWPAMHAAEALTLGGRVAEVRAAVKPRLATETDDQRKCGLARELTRAGDRSQLHLLLEILDRAGSNGHTHAAESLYKIVEVGDGRKLRGALAKPESAGHELMSAAALARGGDPVSLALLRRRLKEGDAEARKLAAWVLGMIGGREDISAIAESARRASSAGDRCYAEHALACLGDPAGRRALVRNLGSRDPAIRTYAAEFAGFARITEAAEKLTRLLDDRNVDVRVRAAQALLVLSSPAGPDSSAAVVSEVYPATVANPRYSEGSVVVLTDGTLLYAVTEFQGGGQDHATARIVARRSPDGGRTWGETRVLQENVGAQNVMSVTLRRLLPGREDGPIGLFYLVKNSSADLQVWLRVSQDECASFGDPIRVTPEPGYHVLNNDRITVLSNGRLICPVAWSPDFRRVNHFVAFCYLSDDGGKTWRRGKGQVDQPRRGAMEPEVIELTDGRALMIVRTQVGIIAASHSSDGGDTWGAPFPLGPRAPEAPATLRRIPATGHLLLIWNDSLVPGADHGGGRTPLSAAVSADEGRSWSRPKLLENDPNAGYAYTSVAFHQNRVLLTYYVDAPGTGRIGSRFRSVPVSWFLQE